MKMFVSRGNWSRDLIALTLGVLLAANFVTGIQYNGVGSLALIVIVLAVLNALLKPLLQKIFILVCWPLLFLSVGLALIPLLWIVNSVLFYLTGILLRERGFYVATFSDAMLGALFVSLASLVLSLTSQNGRNRRTSGDNDGTGPGRKQQKRNGNDDVIDV